MKVDQTFRGIEDPASAKIEHNTIETPLFTVSYGIRVDGTLQAANIHLF
jgi:hypothetical protein